MKHIIQLILFCTVGIPVFAARNYSPNTSNSMTGGGSVCQNGTATTVKFKFNNCYNTVSGSGRIAAPITIYWYSNTANSTTGGTLVSTQTSTTGTSSTKTVTFAPPTTSVGVLYYYCIVTWDGTGKCKTTGTLTSSSARSVTVKGSPAAVTGQMALCPSSSVTLSNSVASGTWSSSNLAVASVNSSTGVVSGVTAGTANISYSTGCGTKTWATVTVNSSVAAIAGTLSMCAGASTTLTNTTAGGTWSSSNTARATVGATTGIVTGITAGTCTITYSIGCGTPATKVVTVNTQPAAITGTAFACVGSTTALSDVTAGGAWTSSATSVATVNSSGTVTALSTGTTNISYTLGSCYSMVTVPVRTTPSAISGFSSICTGQPVSFTNTVSGGTWTSSNNAVATVGAAGDVTGIANGNVTISYNTGCGSTVTKAVTVNSSPAAITGSTSICVAGTTTLGGGTGSGDWSSSTTSIATIGSLSGVVTGVAYGTTTITYNEGSCSATTVVTVNKAPAAITGTAVMCEGATATLANTTNYGIWSSGNTAKATVLNGVVTGIVAGTAVISYATGCGSVATKIATINAQPAAIGGSSEVCATATTTLTNTVPGGVWSSNSTANATVSASGVVTGVANGTAIISYAIGSCYATTGMTVGTLPNAGSLTGTAAICEDDVTSLTSSGDDDGTWTSSNETVATVDISGTVSGNDPGTATISYTVYNTCGSATTTKVVTVTVIPAVDGIDGDDNVCIGQTITLSNSVAGGVWTSSNTKATVSSTGVVTGVTAGTANITYTLTNTCGTDYDFQTVTVNALPAAIGGTATVCEGATTTLTDATTGGAWSSSNTTVATIGTGGVVTGVTAGTTVVTYTSALGCIQTKITTVNVSPSVLTGTMSMCVGATVTLDQTVPGGTWASSAATKASVGTTGIVTGVAAGTANISYSIGTCRAIAQVTVNANPAAITGTASVCEGLTTTLADVTAGGTWSSNDASVATFAADGVVAGINAGNTNITYTLGTGCFAVRAVTVNTTPAALSGTQTVCIGKTTTLTSATPGGVWGSSGTATATVVNGVVTGVSANTATISYTLGTCRVTAIVTVGANPAAIGGTATVCQGSTTSLTDATVGGAWSSNNTSVATIDVDGTVSGVDAGTSNITYSTTLGCIATKVATVNPLPAAISGSATACMGSTSTLSNTTPGGAWASSTTAVATIGATGIVTPVSVGNTNVSYSLPTGCRSTMVVSVNPLPAAGTITGASSVCESATTTLGNTVNGGVWSSSNAAVASVDASGVVSGIIAGNATISYSVTNVCGTAVATKAFVVNPLPNAGSITGASSVCESATTTLSNAVTGGVWSSSDASVASVTAGVVSGVAAGNATISYSKTTACGTDVATKAIVINALPNAGSITGASSVCESATTTLSNAVTGGAWSSSDASVASVTAGVVSGVAAGNATISYSHTTVCGTDIATKAIVVNPLPNAGSITGASSVCESATTTLSNAVTGGVWSSSDASVVSVASGVVSGVAAGNVTISYSKTTACGTDVATKAIVVNPLPNAGSITGASSVCENATTTLSNAVTGGVWSSSDASVASVASGVVSGVAAGNATISYSKTTVCGTDIATKAIVVNPLPNAGSITGASSVCESATTTLSNAVTGGVWSASNASVASVASGVVSGVAAGNATISYSKTTACGTDVATKAIVVNALPNAGSITGASSVCESATTALSNAVTGGVWSSSDASVASVAAGVVSGVAAGNATISYSKTTACGTDVATKAIVVNALPNAGSITGASSVCESATTALSNAVTGGAWSSSDASVASVTSGVVSGVAAGNATISYSKTTACGTEVATKAIVVNALPNAGSITGSSSVCESATTTLNNTVTGGVWSSSDASLASVTAGVVSGVAAGNATISYSHTTVCGTDIATKAIVVTALPSAGSITGAASACQNVTSALANAVSGGAWSSSNASVASVNASGVVDAVSAGNATISYSYTNVCGTAVATKAFVVNPLPDAGAITGASSVCVGATTALNNAITGGVWNSSNTSVAAVNASGVVNGVVAGNVTISYTVTNGCGTARATQAIVVNPLASAGTITGTATVLTGSTTTLASTIIGGVWSGSNATVAIVNGSGVVTGVAGGSACITYTVSNSCGPVSTIRVVTVNSLSAINGTLTVCGGFTTTLSNTATGGTWSSSTSSVATVGSSTGIVTGIAAGTSTITYTVSGNSVTAIVTVNTLAPAITGTARTCAGSTTTLDNNVSGGIWSSANASVASVGTSTGIVTGGATAGVTTITYALGGSCRATVSFTNNALPTITGTGVVCVGTNATLVGSPAGGAWSSNDATIASIASNGIITGASAGTTVMTYTLATGCYKTAGATVNITPAAITGTRVVCSGSTTTLENTVAGGVWSTASTAYAIANASTGVITGGATAGVVNVSYTIGSCRAITTFTNNALPTITGTAVTCVGTSATLTGAPAGGIWNSNDETIATIAANGVVTGATAGTTLMTYTLGTGCAKTATATVSITPGTISGTMSVCQGSTTTFGNDVVGGGWNSSNGAVATITTAGVVNGVNAGTALISYTKGSCRATTTVTVMGLPAVIGGVLKACPGTTTVLTNTTPGGVWNSGNTAVAIIDPFDGTVTGIAPGTVLMSFTMPTGCARTAIVTINATPADVVGSREVCAGSTTALTATGATLSWTSSNTAVATVGVTGIVTGVAAGTADITYKVNTGCYTVATMTVDPLPSVFTGAMKACPGTTTTLGNAIDGGTWVSSNNAVATIDADGVMSGLVVGTTNITYTLPTGCRRIAAATVNPLPGAITGHTITCVGTHTTLSATGGAGTWSSSDASIATIGTPSTGVATGISDGTADITFTLASGCYSTKQVTITPIPDGIIGSVAVCSGLSTALDNATVGGTWASSNAAVANVNTNTGVVTAGTAGTALISYCLGANCRITTSFTVKSLPALIGGSAAACVGATTTLTNTTTGGVWESDNAAVATISASGVVSGIDAGTSNVSYTGTNGCTRTGTVSVFPVPSAITGTNVIAAGEQTTLSNTVAGGTWSGPASAVLSVDAGTGVVTGRTLGVAAVSYTTGGNCRATYVVSVNGVAGLWTGASNTSWSNSANWYGGILPTDTLDVVIPAGTPYAPSVASGVASAKSLNVNSGATVTIAGGAELDVKRAVLNNGSVTGAGELKLNGTTSQLLTGYGKVNNITLDNSAGAVVSASGTDTLNVCGTLLLNNGTLTTNNRAMLLSNASGTGRIGTITGGAISGNVIVQQYVPGRRAWRMMGHPFSTPVALNQLTPSIDVTGAGGAANGFTTTAANETSCFWFNQYISGGAFNSGTDPGWVGFTSTNGATSANQVNQYEGIRIFIRGSKGQGLSSAAYTPSATTIRMQGAVNTGDQTVVMHKGSATDISTGLSTQDFNLLSNPYPSVVDLGTVLKNAYDAGAIRGSSFWVWDPFLGTNGQSVAVPIDGTPYYLPANAAFIVRTNNDGDVLNFTEAHKATTASASLLKTKSDYLTLKIYDESYHPWDMLNVKFSETATNSEDMQDAVKPSNLADLDFYSVSDKSTRLSVDARPYKAGKVVPLGIKSNYAQEFIIRAENVAVPQGGKVYLQDKFLNKRVQLQAGTEYRFEVTTDEKTQGDKRFELQMDPTEVVETAVAAHPMTVSVSPNPATDLVTVNYTTAGKDEVNVSVMSVAGEVIMNRNFGTQKAGKINMTVKDLAAGVYLITIKSGAETSTQRLIKE